MNIILKSFRHNSPYFPCRLLSSSSFFLSFRHRASFSSSLFLCHRLAFFLPVLLLHLALLYPQPRRSPCCRATCVPPAARAALLSRPLSTHRNHRFLQSPLHRCRFLCHFLGRLLRLLHILLPLRRTW